MLQKQTANKLWQNCYSRYSLRTCLNAWTTQRLIAFEPGLLLCQDCGSAKVTELQDQLLQK